MKIAIIGYGKMGKMIEDIAIRRGHDISCIIDKDNTEDFDSEAFKNSDAAIEFTTPSTAAENVLKCFERGVPVICGSTGWTDRLPEMKRLCDEGKGTLLWASNFSIGVNVFKAVSNFLADIMRNLPQYTPSMTEIHHIHKLDHPSGTALTLAEGILDRNDCLKGWTETNEPGKLNITALREGEVPGTHIIKWNSDVDDITITHTAKSRAGFAEGAVTAAEWLAPRRGFHTIGEMMRDITHQDIFK